MPTCPDPATGLTAFAQPVAGCTPGGAGSDATTVVGASPTGRSGAAGFVRPGLREDKLWTFSGRAADGAGLFISAVGFGPGPTAPPAAHGAAYAPQACRCWLVRVDVQDIRHSGGSLDPDHALVVALRPDLTP